MGSDSLKNDEGIVETFVLNPERAQKNLRLDRFVADGLPDLSRNYLQKLIDDGYVLVNGVERRQAFKVTPGQVITVAVPEAETFDLIAEDIPIDIVFENDDVLVINKAAGMVVHPAPGHPSGTLVNAVLHHAPSISIAGSQRPGIVHRLDKDTSGVMVVAKSDRAHTSLVEQWQDRKVAKRYVALVGPRIDEDEATIDAPIGRDPANRMRMAPVRSGKDAVTHFNVVERFEIATLLDVKIETGRTHQIRVHLAMINQPIVGDGLYGNSRSRSIAERLNVKRQFLHASSLGFEIPEAGYQTFEAPLAPDLDEILERARGEEALA